MTYLSGHVGAEIPPPTTLRGAHTIKYDVSIRNDGIKRGDETGPCLLITVGITLHLI